MEVFSFVSICIWVNSCLPRRSRRRPIVAGRKSVGDRIEERIINGCIPIRVHDGFVRTWPIWRAGFWINLRPNYLSRGSDKTDYPAKIGVRERVAPGDRAWFLAHSWAVRWGIAISPNAPCCASTPVGVGPR
jgi:hypothetical protein